MIIQKCDICNREVTIFDTVVLYSKPIDYCRECRGKAEKIKQAYKKEVEYQMIMLESRLKAKESNIIRDIRAKYNKGIVIKK